jgi:2-polyprenyl-3-methyl-5-hydroxy-6-metoxy-1,4-benzoquinol methylase
MQPDHSFDLVVCFEAIEHLEAQQKLMSEAH